MCHCHVPAVTLAAERAPENRRYVLIVPLHAELTGRYETSCLRPAVFFY